MNIRLSGQWQLHDWVYSTLNGLAISHSISIIKGSQCPNSFIFRWSKSRPSTVRQKPQNRKENQRRRIGISQRSCSQSCSEVQAQPFCLSESVQLSQTQRDSFSCKVTVRNRVKQKERSVFLNPILSLSPDHSQLSFLIALSHIANTVTAFNKVFSLQNLYFVTWWFQALWRIIIIESKKQRNWLLQYIKCVKCIRRVFVFQWCPSRD